MSALVENADDCENESSLLNTQSTPVAESSLLKIPRLDVYQTASSMASTGHNQNPRCSTAERLVMKPKRLLSDDDQSTSSSMISSNRNDTSEISLCTSDVNITLNLDTPTATKAPIDSLSASVVEEGQREEEGEDEGERSTEDVEIEHESEEERVRRELEESERLAWELMQQESVETYQMQMNFMQEMSGQMSEEDLAAIRDAMGGGAPVVVADEDIADGLEEGDEEEENEDNDASDDVDNWDYDRLLSLGQALGDVKTERWRRKAPEIIKSLEKSTFAEMKRQVAEDTAETAPIGDHATSSTPVTVDTTTTHSTADPAPVSASVPAAVPVVLVSHNKRIRLESKCMVCLELFECPDDVTLLPCRHFFHDACTAGWLADHNSCPICKNPVLKSP